MTLLMVLWLVFAIILFPPKAHSEASYSTSHENPKIGVLLVNHGFRSATWRESSLHLEAQVAPTIMNLKTAVHESGRCRF